LKRLCILLPGEGGIDMQRRPHENRVAIIGAGAIGGITAALLARAGYDVVIVTKYDTLATKIRNAGLHVFGVRSDVFVPIPAVARVAELSGPMDIVLLATKAPDMLNAAHELLPFLKDTSLVVSLQNGLCEEALAGVVGRQRTIGCVVGWGGTMHGPGELEMTSTGEFVIGSIGPKEEPRLGMLQEMLGSVVPVEISANIRGHLYSKLIVNACITTLGAVCGLYLGQMLSARKVRNIFMAIMREAIAVADAMGLTVEVYAGKLDYYRLLKGDGILDNLRRHLTVRIVGFKYRRLKSSMLQSLERGRPTEIDYLNGYIVAKGLEQGIATPVNNRIVAMVKEIEAGTRAITPRNFDDPFFKSFA